MMGMLSFGMVCIGGFLMASTILIPIMVAEYLSEGYDTPLWAWVTGGLAGIICFVCGAMLFGHGFAMVTPTS